MSFAVRLKRFVSFSLLFFFSFLFRSPFVTVRWLRCALCSIPLSVFVVVFFSVWISAGVSMLEIINYLAKIARFLDPTPR